MTSNPTPPTDSLARLVVSTLLVVTGVGGLLASLCGGFFTLMFLTERGSGPLLLAISLPSLFIGGLIAWACFRAMERRSRAS